MKSIGDIAAQEVGLSRHLPVVRAVQVHSAVAKGRSRPLVIECDDGHRYVVKLRGSAKTSRRLIAEVISGRIAAVLGIPQPEHALVVIQPDLPPGDVEGEKLQELRLSTGLVFGSRWMEGVSPLRRAADAPLSPADSARIVWFDSLILNNDRKWRNTNILMQQDRYWLIDNDSAFHFHHRWADPMRWHDHAFSPISGLVWWKSIEHVLLPWASSISAIGDRLARTIDAAVFEEAAMQVPGEWFAQGFPEGSAIEPALMYQAFLTNRLARRKDWEALADVARFEGTCLERV